MQPRPQSPRHGRHQLTWSRRCVSAPAAISACTTSTWFFSAAMCNAERPSGITAAANAPSACARRRTSSTLFRNAARSSGDVCVSDSESVEPAQPDTKQETMHSAHMTQWDMLAGCECEDSLDKNGLLPVHFVSDLEQHPFIVHNQTDTTHSQTHTQSHLHAPRKHNGMSAFMVMHPLHTSSTAGRRNH